MAEQKKKIFITGGAGYVGTSLVPYLLDKGHSVTVYDFLIFGDHHFKEYESSSNLKIIKADLRSEEVLRKELPGHDTVIHLACISNDPSFDLNPVLGKEINFDSFAPLVEISKVSGVKRFINASSSSVYGIKDQENVTEQDHLEPLTDYSKYKAECEEILLKFNDENFTVVSLRPATVCGYSPRQRLDVVVNILTNHAHHKNKVVIFGGNQKRPNIHIKDMCRAYGLLLNAEKSKISGKCYNVGSDNYTVAELADLIKTVYPKIEIEVQATDDNRSYHISSNKIKEELGFVCEHTIRHAIVDLKTAFEEGKILDPENSCYYNVKLIKEINLK